MLLFRAVGSESTFSPEDGQDKLKICYLISRIKNRKNFLRLKILLINF